MAAGAAKAALPVGTTLVLGVLAGAFIAFGSFLALSVGGACPGLASANPGLQKMVLVRTGRSLLLRFLRRAPSHNDTSPKFLSSEAAVQCVCALVVTQAS